MRRRERPWATHNWGKPITDRQLAKLLKPFGIISETVQTSETGEAAQAKGYRRGHLDDAFDRYLTAPNDASRQIGGSQAYKRTNADEMRTTRHFCERPENNLDAHEKCQKSANDGGLYACTLTDPQNGHARVSDHRNGGNGTVHSDDEAEPDDDLTIPQWLDRRHEVCAQCGAGRPDDPPTIAVTAKNGKVVYVHEQCLRFWKREHSDAPAHGNGLSDMGAHS